MGNLVSIAVDSREVHGIEGVTFIGGEPTLQSGLGCLAARLREAGIGTILFTGRRYEELSDDIAANVDLIRNSVYG